MTKLRMRSILLSTDGSIESKNSAPIVREILPLVRLPTGPTMFLEYQDYRSTRHVIYESSVSVAAPCAPRHRECHDVDVLGVTLTFVINNAVTFCMRIITIS